MTEPHTPGSPQGPENWPADAPPVASTQAMPAGAPAPGAGAPAASAAAPAATAAAPAATAAAPVGPPPRRPSLWRQATSTTGGLVAVIVAGCLALLLVVGVVGTGLVLGLHAWSNHHEARMVKMAGPWGGPFAPGPPGQLKGQPADPGSGSGPGPRLRGNGLGQLLPGAGALGAFQHGEFTVGGTNGPATVMTVQRGTVTEASTSSVTVRSTDGFTATYAMDSSTRGPAAALTKGDTVLVVATKSGAKAVMIRVTGTS